jgi:transposase
LIIELNSVGMSLPEISKKTGLSIGTIQRRLKTYKIDLNFKKEKNIDIPFVLTKLREGFTKKQICNILSISYSTLARKIKIYEETSIL